MMATSKAGPVDGESHSGAGTMSVTIVDTVSKK
jgi:hypothetical protein